MKKQNIIFASFFVVLGLLLAIAPYTFASVCPLGEKMMKCHWTARIELFIGLTTVVFGAVKFFFADRGFQFGTNLALLLNGLGAILVPSVLIGVCGKVHMHCHSVTRPVLIVLGIVLVLTAIVQSVLLWKKR